MFTFLNENEAKQMVYRGVGVLVLVLVGYGINENMLKYERMWKVDWLGFDSDGKNLHQRLLPAIHQFSESNPCYSCLYF